MFAFPSSITKGDRAEWFVKVSGYDSRLITASIFVRGETALDLTGTTVTGGWNFEITTAQSQSLKPGIYLAQLVLFGDSLGRKTIGNQSLTVHASLEDVTQIDTRSNEQRELELVTEAIEKLSNGVAEYYIGDRRMRYTDLPQLYERQKYLQNRIAKLNNRSFVGGRNVAYGFYGW